MEHLHHFGLSSDPFSNEPDLRFFFDSASHRDAQRRVERGLRQRKSLTLMTGDGGMGKTLLARRILESLEEEVFEAALLVMLPGSADATGIMMRFARQIGVDEPSSERAALLGQLYDALAIVREDGRHAVLIIDDAQVMSAEVLSELGGLLSLEYEERRLLSMLLIGSPELDVLVQNDPTIGPRVEVRVCLQGLDAVHSNAYIAHRMTVVGGDLGVIPAAALEALHKWGHGRPRLLNTLADNALFEAYLAGRKTIDALDVERAASDLGVGTDPGATFVAPIPSPILDSALPEAPAAPNASPAPSPSPPPSPTGLDLVADLYLEDPAPAEQAAPPATAAPDPFDALGGFEMSASDVESALSLDPIPEPTPAGPAPVQALPELDLGEEFELSEELPDLLPPARSLAPIDDSVDISDGLSFASAIPEQTVHPLMTAVQEAELCTLDGEELDATYVELIEE